MRRLTATLAFTACLASGFCHSAFAQSLGAPAGRDPATAPGGTEGLAGPRNEAEAIRGGDAVAVPPSPGAIEVEAPPVRSTTPGMEAPMAPPPPRP